MRTAYRLHTIGFTEYQRTTDAAITTARATLRQFRAGRASWHEADRAVLAAFRAVTHNTPPVAAMTDAQFRQYQRVGARYNRLRRDFVENH